MLALTVAVTTSSHVLTRRAGLAAQPGPWLMACQAGDACDYLPRFPASAPWELEGWVERLLGGQQARRPAAEAARTGGPLPAGAWLVAARRPMSPAPDAGVAIDHAVADPAMLGLPAWRAVGSADDLLPWAHRSARRYTGVFYSPMRTNHPAARAAFNRSMLDAVAAHLTPGGTMIVHAACPGRAWPRCWRWAGRCTSGWAARRARWPSCAWPATGRKLLLIAPLDCPARQADRLAAELRAYAEDDMAVLPGDALMSLWAEVPALSGPTGPAPGQGAEVPLERLRRYIGLLTPRPAGG